MIYKNLTKKEENGIKNLVSQVRKEQGITQRELAEKVGISRPYLSDVENCKRQVSGEVMIRIARFLKVKVEEIFFAVGVQHGEQSSAELAEKINNGTAG